MVSQVLLYPPEDFQHLLLRWFEKQGRKNLPWQQPRTPYRVWLSEVMLQQTQVSTVIPYFERFLSHFPTIERLAQAPLDQVFHLWAGLGYYARARHLHQAAQQIVHHYQGEFPTSLDGLQRLPGIGRSTAGAILSLGFDQPAPILDGNVQRVLARIHAIAEWPGLPHIKKQLWSLATAYTPRIQAANYTQAMMDLGALVCTRTQPCCLQCPFSKNCLAYQTGQPQNYPGSKPRKTLPTRQTQCLILLNKPTKKSPLCMHSHPSESLHVAGETNLLNQPHEQVEILLEKRPPIGIWGGLWSLPECPSGENIVSWCQDHYTCQVKQLIAYPSFRHSFTHYHLEIHPVVCMVEAWQSTVQDQTLLAWHTQAQWHSKGLAAPIKRLLNNFIKQFLATGL
jgi:A/G-specific adenine glycosylase